MGGENNEITSLLGFHTSVFHATLPLQKRKHSVLQTIFAEI